MACQRTYSTSDLDLIEAMMNRQAHRSFWAFFQRMKPKHKFGWWQKEAAAALQEFYDDLLAGKRPILLIQAPPQHGKSELVVAFIAWMSGRSPELRTIYASFSERLGVRANLSIQRMMDSAKFKAIFDARLNESNVVSIVGRALRNREILEFLTSDGDAPGGYFRNTTVRGPVTGESLDVGVIDDPLKGREEANSSTVRDNTWEWLTDDFMSRFSDMAGLLGIMTRWHVDDPFGRLIEQNSAVRVLRFEAVATTDEPNRAAGEALFPEHKSLEFLLERKAAMHAAAWEALYQQNPVVIGGEMFRDDAWDFYDALPRILYRIMYADTAQKTKQQHDWSVVQCWGVTDTGKVALIDQVRGKWEAPELILHTAAFWQKHALVAGQGKLRALKIEDKVSGTGLIQTLRRAPYSIPVLPIQRNTDKITRAYDAQPSQAAGLVMLPRSAPWLSDYLTELGQFPNGAYDDQVDPTVDAINELLGAPKGKSAGVW